MRENIKLVGELIKLLFSLISSLKILPIPFSNHSFCILKVLQIISIWIGFIGLVPISQQLTVDFPTLIFLLKSIWFYNLL